MLFGILGLIFSAAAIQAQPYLPGQLPVMPLPYLPGQLPGSIPSPMGPCPGGFFSGVGMQQQDQARRISCQTRLQFLQDRMKSENQLPAVETLKNLMTENKLLIFGEGHSISSRTIYPEVLTHLHKAEPELNCLFMEANETFFARVQTDPVIGLIPTLNKAKELNIRAIPVDHVMGSSNRIRNLGMAKNIRKYFDSGECKKAILIVGANHLKSKPHLDDQSIPALLKNQIAFRSINFMTDAATFGSSSGIGGTQFISRPDIVKYAFMTEFCLPMIPKIDQPIFFRSMEGDEFEYYLLFHST